MAKTAARRKPAKKAEPSIPEQIADLRKMLIRQQAVRTQQHEKLFAVCDGLLAFMKIQMLEHRNIMRNHVAQECVAIQGRIKTLAEAQGVPQWNKFWGENAERITEQFEILKRIEAKYLPAPEKPFSLSETLAKAMEGTSQR